MNKDRQYFEFVESLKNEVQDLTKDWDAEVIFRQARDSKEADCLFVKMPAKEGMGIQRLFTEEIYQNRISGEATMEEILEEVRETLKLSYRVSGLELLDEVNCYEKIRESLILRPLNYDINAEKLGDGVFYQIGDVALTLYINIGSMKNKYVSCMVKSELLPVWEKSVEEVMETAIRNTYCLFPPRLFDSSAICDQIGAQEFMHTAPDAVKTSRGYGIFVTTEISVNGAAAIFMPGVAKRLGELIGADFYIGFLSTEAAVIHDSSLMSPEAIGEALRFQNKTCSGDDFLSEKVYFYSRERDKIEVIG